MDNKKIVSSLIYKFAERFSIKALGFIVSIVLARILTPDEFGQVAIITVFINLCQTFITSGFSTALVQDKNVDQNDYSTVCHISFGISAILALISVLIAPVLGDFYKNDDLVLPIQVYSLSLFIAAISSVQNAKLQREMKFKTVLITSLIATVLSGALGIALALLGAGIWALIAHYFSYNVFSVILVFIADKWYPKFVFSIKRAKELFSYGWKMLVSAMLCSLYADIRTLVIGKMFSSDSLGYYNRGQQIPEVISGTLDSSMQSVMLPVLSRSQDNKEQVKAFLRNTIKYNCFIIIPAMVGLAVVARPLVLFLLTEKWLSAVDFIQISCIGYAAIPLVSSCLVSIKAIGRSDVYMRLEIIRRIAMLGVLLTSMFVFKSVEAIAWGFVASSWIDVLIVSIPTKRLVGYGLFDQLKDIWKIILSSLIMGCVVFSLGLLKLPPFAALLLQVLIGITVYFIACIMLRESCITEIKKALCSYRNKKS